MLFLFLLSQNHINFEDFNAFKARRTQFSDVFSTSGSNVQQCTQSGTNRFILSNRGDAYVANCNFHDITSDSRGGAIGCSTSSESSTIVARLLIEETTFTTCKTTNIKGGGIFFNNGYTGECVIFRTCAFDCSSTNSSNSLGGQYAYIITNNEATCKNEVNETTITGIKKQASAYPHYALRLQYSNIICSSVNITNNECCYYTALYCCPNYDASAFTCCIIYTSIVNNSANGGYGCILLCTAFSRHLIFTSNIINNKQSTNVVATILTYVNLFINESCIIGNNEGRRVFYEDGNSCQITITNCTLDSDIITKTRYSGTFIILSSKEYNFINGLRHIVTENCESLLDPQGLLVVLREIPKRTTSCHVITPYCKCLRQHNNVGVL